MDLRHRVARLVSPVGVSSVGVSSVGVSFVGVTLICAASAVGCGDGNPPQANARGGPPPPAPDSVASGEVAESRDEAFGLALPAGLRVTRRDHDLVMAEGSLPPEQVSNFVRSRIQGGSEEIGPGRTTFLHTTTLKPVTAWRGTLRIDVEGDGKFTKLRVFGEQAPFDLTGRTFPSASPAQVRESGKPGERDNLPPKL